MIAQPGVTTVIPGARSPEQARANAAAAAVELGAGLSDSVRALYNRHGEAFDVGETFSGVDYEDGVRAAREFAALVQVGRVRDVA